MKIIEIIFNLYFFFAYIIIRKIALITVQIPIRHFMKSYHKLTPKIGNNNFEILSQKFVDGNNMFHASGFMCIVYFSINITIVNIISRYMIPLYSLFDFNKIIFFVMAVGIIPHYYISIRNDNYIKYFRLFKKKYNYYRTKYVYLLIATLCVLYFCYFILI